jgi:hypothetical protein
MSEMETLWGDLIDTDKLGPIIDKQVSQAKGAAKRGPMPSAQLASMIVKSDSPPEEWYKSHQKMLDFISHNTTDMYDMKEGYHKFLTEYQEIARHLIFKVKALQEELAKFKELYNQNMADLAMVIDQATGEDNDTGNDQTV